MLSVFSSPGRYVQGPNATAALGSELKYLGFGGTVVIVASNSATRNLGEVWKKSLGQHGFNLVAHQFPGECTAEEVQRIAALARKSGSQVIVGAGGGKAIDAARAAAAALDIGFVSAPTLASSDAPCSALSVIYNMDGTVSEYRIFKRNPDLVLVDTCVIAKAPPRLLISGMGDALATWFEARTCAASKAMNMRGGASTRSALTLAELCYKTLLADGVHAINAVKSGKVNDALERLVEANTLLSGLGFESSGLAAAHAVHNGLTVMAQTRAFYHGEKVAFGVLVQLKLEGAPDHEFNEVLTFSRSVGLPVTLAGVGVKDATNADLMAIATRTCAPGETIHNEPFAVSAEMLVEAIRDADSHADSDADLS